MAVKMPIGYESFARLRRDGCYYVDKTGALETFLEKGPALVTLFTRPRRFGKSLTMSMMADFFDITRDSRDIFAGLRISENEPLCARWMNQYPVVFMSLKDIDGVNFSRALASFRETVMDVCAKYGQLQTSSGVLELDRKKLIEIIDEKAGVERLQRVLFTLTRALEAHYGRPAIVLIDEYDVPVANAWKNGYYNEMMQFMRGFLGAALKGNDSLEFGVLTGCLRITKESLFTGLNNLKCFGIDGGPYADMFGFTGAEVEALLAGAGLSDRRDIVREWYDGYCFGKHRDIYCPWSILNYINDTRQDPDNPPEAEAYWVHTSSNDLTGEFVDRLASGQVLTGSHNRRSSVWCVQQIFEDVQSKMPLLWAGKSIAAKINKTPSYDTLYDDPDNFWTLLYMTGYLTKTDDESQCIDEPEDDTTILVIPNMEVREVFKNEIDRFFKHVLPVSGNEYHKAIWNADAEQLEQLLSEFLLQNVSYYDTQGTSRNETSMETFYHGLLLGILSRKYDPRSNQEAGHGRYDIQCVDKRHSRAAVIEIKRTRKVEELDRAVEAGLQQIAAQAYDCLLRGEGYRTILHWSLAFCGKRCRVGVRVIDNARA